MDDTVPYTEEELAALYPNPQLDANKQFIDQFIKVCVCACVQCACDYMCVHVLVSYAAFHTLNKSSMCPVDLVAKENVLLFLITFMIRHYCGFR